MLVEQDFLPYSRSEAAASVADTTPPVGKPYEIETHSIADLKAGELRSTWKPLTPAEEEQAELVKVLVRGFLLHAGEGHASGSDEWNRIFPDYEFIGVEEYLAATLGKA